jgi:hypothetical protein
MVLEILGRCIERGRMARADINFAYKSSVTRLMGDGKTSRLAE